MTSASSKKFTQAQSPPSFPLKTGQLFINNEFCDATEGRKTDVIDPATENVLVQVAEANEQDTKNAITVARQAFEQGHWQQMSGYERSKILWRIGDLILENGEELAFLQTKEMGRLYTSSMEIDIPFLSSLYHYYAGLVTNIEGSVKQVVNGAHVYTRQEPLGVVAAITPFNIPLILAACKFAPALTAGNTIVHKPASSTPLSALKMAEIIRDAGTPPGVFNVVTGPSSVVSRLLSSHPDIEKVAITGSIYSGVRIIKSSADTVKHLTMELGGKCVNIVFADADLEMVGDIAYHSMFNKGEICSGGSRMLVERSVYEDVIARIKQKMESLKIGNPLDPDVKVGPVASKTEYVNFIHYTNVGCADGARLVTGGKPFNTKNGKGYYVEPTIFADVQQSMTIAQEETLGSILVIIPFNTFEEAIDIANASQYGLAAAVHSSDFGKVQKATAQLEAGVVWVNTYGQFDVSIPFGGYKMSGYGKAFGRESLQHYLQSKTVWLNWK